MKNKATQTGAIFGLAMIAIIAAVTTIAATPEATPTASAEVKRLGPPSQAMPCRPTMTSALRAQS